MTDHEQILTDNLQGVLERLKNFQVELAFGDLLIALNLAAAHNVTLSAEHHNVLHAIKTRALRSYPASVFGIEDKQFPEWLTTNLPKIEDIT